MGLTATARRMLDSLPSYYDGEPLVERIIQARANEIDRFDALLDKLAAELQPGQATDDLGLLAMWEMQFDLPVRPAATEAQRSDKLVAALRKLDSGSSASVLETLEAGVGGPFVVLRNTPTQLSDTIAVPFPAGTYTTGQVEAIARKMWPAHRGLFMRYDDGFILDLSRFDADTF